MRNKASQVSNIHELNYKSHPSTKRPMTIDPLDQISILKTNKINKKIKSDLRFFEVVHLFSGCYMFSFHRSSPAIRNLYIDDSLHITKSTMCSMDCGRSLVRLRTNGPRSNQTTHRIQIPNK